MMITLEKAFQELKIPYTGELLDQFKGYMELILQWNEKINLTAITDREEFIKKHYIDSILCYGFDEMQGAQRIIDVGTGAGFPGIPLALIFPDKQFILMDSLNKRLRVVDELCESLNIKNVTTIHGRAEDLARDKSHREQYGLCVSRAVANLATLAEYCLPFIKQGGSFLAYKGVKADEEIKGGKKAIELLGGAIQREEKVVLPFFELEHTIIVIHKNRKTDAKYPRKAGTPSKEPLK